MYAIIKFDALYLLNYLVDYFDSDYIIWERTENVMTIYDSCSKFIGTKRDTIIF